ncbi:MAG: hypothetical protein GY714_23435 [Desulfobacterales bacterium]|nr:hypothetical protein [Desulfobacterales bacterium]
MTKYASFITVLGIVLMTILLTMLSMIQTYHKGSNIVMSICIALSMSIIVIGQKLKYDKCKNDKPMD